MDTLEQLFSTGALGGVCVGCSRAKIEDFLGPPDDVGGGRKNAILRYGHLELSFIGLGKEATVSLIAIYFYERIPKLPSLIRWIGWMPMDTATAIDFERYAEKVGREFSKIPMLCFGEQEGYSLGRSDIMYRFRGGKWNLESIQTK